MALMMNHMAHFGCPPIRYLLSIDNFFLGFNISFSKILILSVTVPSIKVSFKNNFLEMAA